MGQTASSIFKSISSFFSKLSDKNHHQQQNPNQTSTPLLPTHPESTINIIFDNTSRINLYPPHASSINIARSSSPEKSASPTGASSSQCYSDEEAINSHFGEYIIDVNEAESSISPGVKWKNHYCSDHRILLVGEGDFSFSASLGKVFGSANNIIATSLNPREYLQSNYGNAMSNIQYLKDRGGIVLHGVDATQMANYLFFNGFKFDRIVFNFPHAGFFINESRQTLLRRHRALVGGFLENAKKMISENGEIHITHKSRGFFQEWNIEALAVTRGLRLLQELHFNYKDYPGYRTKYGYGGDKNFNCNPSRTYKFGLST